MTHSIQKIRPAARLLKTIGQDLVKDVHAAIVELVKNAYDADSPDVLVSFDYDDRARRLVIAVADRGHGMDFNTVVGKWLVPATDDKLKRKRSRKGRVLQGRKGIGRFAAAILGDRVMVETTCQGMTTSLLLDMAALDKVEYLDEVELDIEEKHTGKPDGTRIAVRSDDLTAEGVRDIWNPRQLHKLFVELRSLIAPEDIYNAARQQGYEVDHDLFDITLKFGNFPVEKYHQHEILIKPYPMLDLYDYKIHGRIDEHGNAELKFDNNNVPSLEPELVRMKIPIDATAGHVVPGEVFVDLRVYDRDPDSIENIIKRGLKDPDTGDYVGKREARRILDEHYGIAIYREQFRIRPYGEQSFDWLDLDKKRVRNPSYKIGHNQIVGFVYVRPEEQSGLQEKSARDGLVENGAYYGLVSTVANVINQLEGRRFSYRQKAGRGGRARNLDKDVDRLFDFSTAKKRIAVGLDRLGMPTVQRRDVGVVVDEALESESQEKAGLARKIRETIAVYQGQATLGKITHVLLHEGRKHIKYISETVPRVVKWLTGLLAKPDQQIAGKIRERSDRIKFHAEQLSSLFKRFEPFARTRRQPNKYLDLETEMVGAFEIFASDLKQAGIEYRIDAKGQPPPVLANAVDLMTVFSNLIENSVYWLSQAKQEARRVDVQILEEEGKCIVEYRDSGPGFHGGNLKLMFEPGYSTKPNGTGLGLTLAGEAMSRMGGRIEAKHSTVGAVFELTFENGKL